MIRTDLSDLVTRQDCRDSHDKLVSTAQAWGMWALGILVTLITGAVLWIIAISSTSAAMGQRMDSHERAQTASENVIAEQRKEDKADITARLERIEAAINGLSRKP